MATTFTYTPPLAKPTGFTVTRIPSGGTWIAGSYKFIAFTTEDTNYNGMGASSPMTDVFELDVQDGDALVFDFGTVDPNANYFGIMFEKLVTSGSWKWIQVNLFDDAIADMPYTSTAPRHYWYNYVVHPYMTYPYKPSGLSVSDGWFHMVVTGSGDNIGVEEINDALRSNAPEYDGVLWMDGADKALTTIGNFDFKDYGVGTLNFNDNAVTLANRFIVGDDLNVSMDNTLFTAAHRTLNTNAIEFNNFNVENSKILSDVGIVSPSVYFRTTYTGGSIVNSFVDCLMINSNYGDYIGAANRLEINGVYLWDADKIDLSCDMMRVKSPDAVITNSAIRIDFVGYIFLAFGNTALNTEFRDTKFYSSQQYTSYGANFEIGDEVDLDFLFWTYPSSVYHYANDTGTGSIIFSNTCSITVKDDENNPLPYSSIIITDSSGVVVYNDSTDENGQISTVIKHLYISPAEPPTPAGYNEVGSIKVENNPFTFTISKGGYQVVTLTKEILEKQDIDIVLLELPVDPDAVGLTNAYETESMRHLFLNEPILNIGDAGGLLPSVDPGYFYIALLTDSPGEAGSIASEATFGGYARVAVPRTAAGWTEFLGRVRNFNQINFALSLSGEETITHYAIMKQATGSEMVAYGALDDPTLILPTQQLQFSPAQMEFKID